MRKWISHSKAFLSAAHRKTSLTVLQANISRQVEDVFCTRSEKEKILDFGWTKMNKSIRD